jgi:hypothetical protein
VPCCSVRLRAPLMIPPVPASSSSTPSPSSPSAPDARRRFLCALAAHSGAGCTFSNWRRSRRSYSRPPRASSSGASRSLRSRRADATSMVSVASSGSVQAGAFPTRGRGRMGACVVSDGAGVGSAFSGSDTASATLAPVTGEAARLLPALVPKSSLRSGPASEGPPSTKKS